MVSVVKVREELNTIKNHVIGVFKVRNKFHLVMNYQETNQTIDLLTITDFGALHQEFNVPNDYGTLFLFPDNKNLNQMTEDPFEWARFCNQFNN